jgi:hypothetical protein
MLCNICNKNESIISFQDLEIINKILEEKFYDKLPKEICSTCVSITVDNIIEEIDQVKNSNIQYEEIKQVKNSDIQYEEIEKDSKEWKMIIDLFTERVK